MSEREAERARLKQAEAPVKQATAKKE